MFPARLHGAPWRVYLCAAARAASEPPRRARAIAPAAMVPWWLQRAPFVQFDEQGRMRLWDIEGSIRIDRGTILIHQLEYSTPRRILRVWGDLRPDQAEVVLRFVPVRAESTRAGVGMVAFRSPTDERYRFRLARPEELLPSLNANETLGGSVRRRLQQADQ